jgi:hypothetical protein
LRVRLGCTLDPRTQNQYENVRLEGLEKLISPRSLFLELAQIAEEPSPGDVLQNLEQEKLLSLFSPALTGPKLNLAGFARLQKAAQLVPFGVDLGVGRLGLFLKLLTERLSPKEKAALAVSTDMRKSEAVLGDRVVAGAKKLEKELKSPKLKKASQVYQVLIGAPGEAILLLYLSSALRMVQDRIRNYLQKYLPAAQEITDRQIAATGLEPGTPKFKRAREEMIRVRLDSRPKKVVEAPTEGEPALPAAQGPHHHPGSPGRPRGRPPGRMG